jgi:hypothetical protein
VVKLRFFAGLPALEVARALGLSLSTAERSWSDGRTWLDELAEPVQKYSKKIVTA